MTPKEARKIIIESKKKPIPISELDEAFLVYWDSQPKLKDFTKVMNGALFTPAMIYYITGRR